MARRGIATIAINVVGHGFGPLGTLTVNRTAGRPSSCPPADVGSTRTATATIDSTEGVNAAPPQTLIGNRDGLRQTVIDLMQLVREIEVGVDVDGDGTRDLDPAKISYFGQSFGGIYGTKFLAVEPNVRAGVPNVPGGAIIEIARLSPAFRPLVDAQLARPHAAAVEPAWPAASTRTCRCATCRRWSTPSRAPWRSSRSSTRRNGCRRPATRWPTRRTSARSRSRRAGEVGHPPVRGGDQTVPNPTTTAIIRAGGLQDRTTLFRNDLAFAADPTIPKNPHTFLTNSGLSPPAPVPWPRGQDRSRSSSPRAARSSSIRTAPGRSSRCRCRRTAGGSGLHPVTLDRRMRELLELLEAGPSNSLLPGLAWLAGQEIELDAEEVKATVRRAELLLAAGGDPRRELELDGRAVTAVADDLDEPGARGQLEDSLARLATEAEGLAAVSNGAGAAARAAGPRVAVLRRRAARGGDRRRLIVELGHPSDRAHG